MLLNGIEGHPRVGGHIGDNGGDAHAQHDGGEHQGGLDGVGLKAHQVQNGGGEEAPRALQSLLEKVKVELKPEVKGRK